MCTENSQIFGKHRANAHDIFRRAKSVINQNFNVEKDVLKENVSKNDYNSVSKGSSDFIP